MRLKNFKLVFLFLLVAACKDSKRVQTTLQTKTSISIQKKYNNKTLQVFATAKDTEFRLKKIKH